jgi:hypothetical protein
MESYLYYYRVQGTGTRRYGAASHIHRAESQGDSCSPSTSGEAYSRTYLVKAYHSLGLVQLHGAVLAANISIDRGGEVPGLMGR